MEMKYYDLIFWILVSAAIILSLLLGFGIISTPQIVDFSPSLLLGFAVVYFRLWLKLELQKFEQRIDSRLKKFEEEFAKMREEHAKMMAEARTVIDIMKMHLAKT